MGTHAHRPHADKLPFETTPHKQDMHDPPRGPSGARRGVPSRIEAARERLKQREADDDHA